MEEISFSIHGQVTATAVERFEQPRNYGPLKSFDGHAKITGPCGDTMEVWLRVHEERISEVSFTTTGCGPSRAAGSMATELAVGKPPTEASQIGQIHVLAGLGGLPRGSEHCALLASNTLKAAIQALGDRDTDPARVDREREYH